MHPGFAARIGYATPDKLILTQLNFLNCDGFFVACRDTCLQESDSIA